MYKDFDELTGAVRRSAAKRIVAIAAAEDEAVVAAALRAQAEGVAEPIFVGDAAKIRAILDSMTGDSAAFSVVGAAAGEAGQRAAELVMDGRANILMKGLIETRDFLGPVVRKENGLGGGGIMSHVAFFAAPHYHKLLLVTDGGMVMYPTLADKRHIIDNATKTLRAMGYERPKHAVVCAIETVNPKMNETVEAAELQRLNETGEIRGCTVVGPISYDVAMDKGIARHKGFESRHCGDFDCLIMPNIQAGNILGKCLAVTCRAAMAGIVVGARIPVVMTSRGSGADEKFYSIAMAALVTAGAAL